MLIGAATTVYFFAGQREAPSPILISVLLCLFCFSSVDAFRQLHRAYNAHFREGLRGELEFDGVHLVCKPPGRTEVPILREQCRHFYPCRETIVLNDGRLLELRPVHPMARHWGTPHTYFTRALFEAWWPSINLDTAEKVALDAFQKQRGAIDAIFFLALVAFYGVGFFIHLSRLSEFTVSDKSWILVPVTMSIGILWPLYLWNQAIRDKAVIPLPSSDDESAYAEEGLDPGV